MKTSATFILFVLLATAKFASAQDTIFKHNNDLIIAKIMEVAPSEIKYKRFDLPDGPLYSIPKSEITKIKYSNGLVDVFTDKPASTNVVSATIEPAADLSRHYVLTMTEGTQLHGKIISETKLEVVFLDNNIGEKTISRKNIKSLKPEYGEETWVFTLTDGSIITGKIVNKTGSSTVVETKALGTIDLPASRISNVRELDEATITESGKIWFKNPNCTRYLFAPSAIPLKKGEGYYQNIYGMGNAVNFGLNSHVTLGGGLVGPLGVYINTKVGFKIGEYAHVAAGALVGNSFFPLGGNNFGFGIGFAVVTLGNYDHNITIGSGYGFVNQHGSTYLQEKPLFVANGMARIGKKYALVSENWIVNQKNDIFDRSMEPHSHYETYFSYAFRYMGQRSTLDAGFVNTPGLIRKGWYIGIPYIGFVIRFGKYKDN